MTRAHLTPLASFLIIIAAVVGISFSGIDASIRAVIIALTIVGFAVLRAGMDLAHGRLSWPDVIETVLLALIGVVLALSI